MKRSKFARGSATLEFALVLPMLALMLFGIIQYGFIFASYITLRNASAVAARFAVLTSPTPSQSDIQSVAYAAITPMLSTNNLQTPSITSATLAAGILATNVTLKYNLPLIIPFVVPGKTEGGSLTISATTVMK